jgi:DNA-binding XRE family transcriptional regulator
MDCVTKMSTMQQTRTTTCNADQEKNWSVIVEGLFGFFLKGAKRLVSLAPDDLKRLKRLAAEFMGSPEHERPEILQSIVELLLPDEHIGGVDSTPPEIEPARREKLDRSRQYIGSQIKLHRERAGLTQESLARKAKIPQSHVCRLERGKHVPSHITIDRIAKALKISPALIDPGRADLVEGA